MALGLTAQDNALADFTARYTWISLHSGDPGDDGSNEIAYTAGGRLQVSWPTVIAHQVIWVGQLIFQVPIGTVLYCGIWDSAAGGVFADGQVLAAPRTFIQPGSLQLAYIALAAS